jgi:hypothetical protein
MKILKKEKDKGIWSLARKTAVFVFNPMSGDIKNVLDILAFRNTIHDFEFCV